MGRTALKKSTISGISLPVFGKIKKDSNTFNEDFVDALYYIHYEINNKTLKAEVIKYAKNHGLYSKKLDECPDYSFAVIGKACYVYNRGGDLPEIWIDSVSEKIENLIKERHKKDEENQSIVAGKSTSKRPPNIQDRLKEHAASVAGVFDLWVDEFVKSPKTFNVDKCDPYSVMMDNNIKMAHARWIKKFYEQDYKEIIQAIDGSDEDIKEGYKRYNKTQLKKFIKLYEKIFDAANLIIETSKSSRKPRKKKQVDKSKLVSKLKYRQADKDLSLVSINPLEIIGAKVLWVYNTKTRKLGKYIADDYDGLGIKGTTIQGFDKNKSVEKTLRKPKEQLSEFKKAGKVKLRKFMDSIKTIDTKMKGRINEHHILLKVEK